MKRQQRKAQVLTFITRTIASNGEAPTMAEIGRHVGLNSSGSVFEILRELEHDGAIKRSRRARGIELVTKTDQVRGADAERMGGAPLARDARAPKWVSAPSSSVREVQS